MTAHDVALFGDQIAATRLSARFAAVEAPKMLRLAIEDVLDRVARGVVLRRDPRSPTFQRGAEKREPAAMRAAQLGQGVPETLDQRHSFRCQMDRR